MSLMQHVGQRIREFRQTYAGKGISQEELAKHLNVATNTISRWETAAYEPTLDDLDRLARFFEKSLMEFFPPEDNPPANQSLAVLMRAAQGLTENDLEELQRYAEYRKVRSLMKQKAQRKRE